MLPRVQPPKVPNDGPGPRGGADCYYTSRRLDSTFRYMKFAKKLRAMEEEQRKGEEQQRDETKVHRRNQFFELCERRALIKDVGRRVDLCMRSYEADLNDKRSRLVRLYSEEEQENLKKLVVQAQAGNDLNWQEKVDRLEFLLEKRKKEADDRNKETPISKCVHVTPCITKRRAKEVQQIQLYQIKENQARKEAEREIERMWEAVQMKESEALAARLEKDAIERYRRDTACLAHSDYILEQRKLQRERDRERLKQEQLALKRQMEDDARKEREALERERQRQLDGIRERNRFNEETRQKMEKKKAEQKEIQDTWDNLTKGMVDDNTAEINRWKRRELETTYCNQEIAAQKENLRRCEAADEELRKLETKRQQDTVYKQRCDYLAWSRNQNKEVRQAMIDQINERKDARERTRKLMEEEDLYRRQLFDQSQQLMDYKVAMDDQATRDHQANLLAQIEYNKLLKERAKQEEAEQIRKGKLAREEYEQVIKEMLARPFTTEKVHPFMRAMNSGLRMREKCPCSKPDYCGPPAEGSSKQ